MEFRQISTKDEYDQAAELAATCFHESVEDMKNDIKEFSEQYFLGAFEDNQLQAAADGRFFEIFIRNQLLKCAGIAFVMTSPVYRRKGLIKKLMNILLRKMKDDGYVYSVLWPFEHKFYGNFGYASIEKAISYKIKPSNIRKDIQKDENISIRRYDHTKDYEKLNKIAKNAINKYTRIVGKEDAWKLRSHAQKFKMYLFERGEEPVGYFCFKLKKNGEYQRDMNILDIAYIDILSKKTMLSFLRNFDSDIKHILINLPYEEEILSYLEDYNTEHKFAAWPAMLRILDIKNSFEGLKYSSKITTILYLKLEDKIIEENSGIWKLNISKGECLAVKTTEEDVLRDRILEISVNKLTQLLAGYDTLPKLLEAEETNIPEEWLDPHLFPSKPCSIMVWF
ncbi:MAG: GNAT family N-acetyltransferase [Candidatus Heimdallarchaeaceae archaeon]